MTLNDPDLTEYLEAKAPLEIDLTLFIPITSVPTIWIVSKNGYDITITVKGTNLYAAFTEFYNQDKQTNVKNYATGWTENEAIQALLNILPH